MLVKDLIEKLKELDQNAVVEVYNGYDPEYGESYKDDFELSQEVTGYCMDNEVETYTVFLG